MAMAWFKLMHSNHYWLSPQAPLPEWRGEPARLVSVMLANHETGVLQPIEQLAAVCRSAGVPLHTDAVAAAGKVPINFRTLGVAAMSIAAHKFQGPLGIAPSFSVTM